jgi:hypothetical protein
MVAWVFNHFFFFFLFFFFFFLSASFSGSVSAMMRSGPLLAFQRLMRNFMIVRFVFGELLLSKRFSSRECLLLAFLAPFQKR